MIKINTKEYSRYTTKITWGDFEVNSHDKKRTGKSPFITFNIENNIFIGLELTFSKEMFENTKLHKEINIKQYVCDIIYENRNGWISIIDGKYDCNITKIGEREFKMKFFVEAEFYELKININVDTNIEL